MAGIGPKFARTAFPVIADKVGTAGGTFYLYRVDAAQTPDIIRRLFGSPTAVPEAFKPFETQYDTYLMKYEDIIERQDL